MPGITRRVLIASLAAPAVARAQGSYPDRAIRMLVGFAAGGSADVLARIVATAMAERLGQPVVVENRPGAGSRIAAQATARAQADGYAIMMGSSALPVQQALEPGAGFDPVAELTPIAMLADAPNILVVTPSLNVRSVAELVALAKQPGRNLAFGSSGAGTSLHLCGELLRVRTGAAMTHVPYRGSAPALTALMSGEVPMMFDSLATALPLIQAGSIRAMAVTTKERSPILPDVPTMAELGFPDFDVSVWFGLFGPAGLPRPVVERLAAVVDAYLNDPRTAGQLQPLSMAIRRLPGPAAFRDFFVGDMQRWKDIVTSTGVTVG